MTMSAGAIAGLSRQFAQHHCVLLPALLAADVLQGLTDGLARARFNETVYYAHDLQGEDQEFAKDLMLAGGSSVMHALNFVMNRPALFEAIEQITGCQKIGCFYGRIYRSLPGSGHHLDWHDDLTDRNRLIGLSLNLSGHQYEGGVFQLRERISKRVTAEVAFEGLGTAHIFRIDPAMEHRVTPITGSHPRTMAAGWFMSQPAREFVLRSLYSPEKSWNGLR
jgi:hypothetical protein